MNALHAQPSTLHICGPCRQAHAGSGAIALLNHPQDEALGLAETDEGRDYGTYLDADVLFRLTPGLQQVGAMFACCAGYEHVHMHNLLALMWSLERFGSQDRNFSRRERCDTRRGWCYWTFPAASEVCNLAALPHGAGSDHAAS